MLAPGFVGIPPIASDAAPKPMPRKEKTQPFHYRMLTPLLVVNILVAKFIAASSWNMSFAAYGMMICAILVLFLHGRHSNWFFLRDL